MCVHACESCINQKLLMPFSCSPNNKRRNNKVMAKWRKLINKIVDSSVTHFSKTKKKRKKSKLKKSYTTLKSGWMYCKLFFHFFTIFLFKTHHIPQTLLAGGRVSWVGHIQPLKLHYTTTIWNCITFFSFIYLFHMKVHCLLQQLLLLCFFSFHSEHFEICIVAGFHLQA